MMAFYLTNKYTCTHTNRQAKNRKKRAPVKVKRRTVKEIVIYKNNSFGKSKQISGGCACACVNECGFSCVRFVTFESVHWIINRNLLLILCRTFCPPEIAFVFLALTFFSFRFGNGTNFPINFWFFLVMFEFSIQLGIFISIHWLADWFGLAGWLHGWLQIEVAYLCIQIAFGALCSIHAPSSGYFSISCDELDINVCVCALVSLTKNDCLAYGIITEYRDNPSEDLPSAQWNCVHVCEGERKRKRYETTSMHTGCKFSVCVHRTAATML